MECREILQPDGTVRALVESAAAVLAAAGVDSARLNAEVLLALACGIDRAGLYARWRSAVAPDSRWRFDEFVARRRRREPLQYIAGDQEFWSLDFLVTPAVLIPRPETELLIELVLQTVREASFRSRRPLGSVDKREPHPSRRSQRKGPPAHEHTCQVLDFVECGQTCSRPLQAGVFAGAASQGERNLSFQNNQFTAHPEEPPSSGGVSKGARSRKSIVPAEEGQREGARGRGLRVCDLGTGSGCIAVALAYELQEAEIWALDISETALAVARLNARKHGVAERIRFVNCDGCAAVRRVGFDVIVCNPPYVSSGELETAQPELAWEPRQALDGGRNGLTVIQRLLAESPASLKPGGWLLMEIGADQGPAVERLARAANFTTLSIRPDYAGLPRALVARR